MHSKDEETTALNRNTKQYRLSVNGMETIYVGKQNFALYRAISGAHFRNAECVIQYGKCNRIRWCFLYISI